MFGFGNRWDATADVIVIGTGGAGLTAAIAAHDAGASVLLLEKSQLVGGTTAVSGGVVWVPNNAHMAEVSIEDSAEAAYGYIQHLADGRSDDALIRTFVDTAPEMIAYLEANTPLKFTALEHYPDYHPEFEGGRSGGRSLDAGLFESETLGDWKTKLRKSPVFGMTPMTVAEATSWNVFSNPLGLPFSTLADRAKKQIISSGASLVAGLLKGCLDRGVEPQLGVRARSLIEKDGQVAGVEVETGGETLRYRANKGVVLATGGFEWSQKLVSQFLGGELTHPNSPPSNTGDGLEMAMRLGADLGNMAEAWWCPSVVIPGEEYDGVPLNRGDFAIRSLPHSVLVNRKGKRFVNEAHNYNDMVKPFFDFDPVAYERPNLPCWLILDQQFVDKYALVTAMPGMATPNWVEQADSLEALSEKLGVHTEGLLQTIARFNGFASEGIDRDFRRGESVYDHFYGDPEHKPNPNLGTLEQAPFYALQVFPGAIGTKGGPRTDQEARVLRVGEEPIGGLYAAGNVAAGVTGPGYPGAGATIGMAMTWGFIAGKHAASR